jgi:hypothetical protein
LLQIAIFIGIQTERMANDRFAAVILAHSSTGFGPTAARRRPVPGSDPMPAVVIGSFTASEATSSVTEL